MWNSLGWKSGQPATPPGEPAHRVNPGEARLAISGRGTPGAALDGADWLAGCVSGAADGPD
jgi:hypothetical protein